MIRDIPFPVHLLPVLACARHRHVIYTIANPWTPRDADAIGSRSNFDQNLTDLQPPTVVVLAVTNLSNFHRQVGIRPPVPRPLAAANRPEFSRDRAGSRSDFGRITVGIRLVLDDAKRQNEHASDDVRRGHYTFPLSRRC